MIHTNYIIGLIDGENALSTNENVEQRPYGIPKNARGVEYFKKVKEGDLVFGYKTKRYRDRSKGKKWQVLPRVPCKNHGIFAVFKVMLFKDKSVFKDISGNGDWFKEHKDWDKDYTNVIFLSKPLLVLKNPITFEDLKNLVPESEYVNNYRRSVTRFSKTEAKKLFRKMVEKENNPKIAEKIKTIFQMDLN